MNGRTLLDYLLVAVVVFFGGRTAQLCVAYFLSLHAQRFQLETSALWFIVAAALLTLTRRSAAVAHGGDEDPPAAGYWVLWVLAALALYWPALTVGFLSDDFGLIDRSSAFAFGWFNREAFRPLPLAVWAVILHLGGGPIAIHVLNVALHGTNAFLTTRIVAALARRRSVGLCAGLVVLTMPVVVEAVVWCSGVFDVMATTFVLLAVLAGRDYETPTTSARIRLLGLCIAALLCKETAVVVPVLIALDAWARRSRAHRLYVDLTAILAGMAIVGVARLALASPTVRRPVSKYLVQRWAFGTIGGLATPWHADVIRAHPWLVIVAAWLLIVLLAMFALRRFQTGSTRVLCSMAAWTLVATAPAITFFFVAPDLQNSRYLYLATAGWAGLLASMVPIAPESRAQHVAAVAVLFVLSVFFVYGVRAHIQPWREAAIVRDGFELAAMNDPGVRACSTLRILNAPDSIRGAYVLRNGAVEALRRDLGFSGRLGVPAAGCSFVWDATTGRLARGSDAMTRH